MLKRMLLAALLLAPLTLAEGIDDYTGSYASHGRTGDVVLTLEEGTSGLVGSLTGLGETFALKATQNDSEIRGSLNAEGAELGFVAQLDGTQLTVKMFALGSDAKMDDDNGQKLVFERRGPA